MSGKRKQARHVLVQPAAARRADENKYRPGHKKEDQPSRQKAERPTTSPMPEKGSGLRNLTRGATKGHDLVNDRPHRGHCLGCARSGHLVNAYDPPAVPRADQGSAIAAGSGARGQGCAAVGAALTASVWRVRALAGR